MNKPMTDLETAKMLQERGIVYFHFGWDMNGLSLTIPAGYVITEAIEKLRSDELEQGRVTQVYTDKQ